MSNKILQNALKITEAQKVSYLVSSHRHDFRSYDFQNGGSIFIDGGCDYFRRGAGGEEMPKEASVEDFSLSETDSFEKVKERLVWGSYGKTGKEELKYLPLYECETSHLKAILKTQNVSVLTEKVIKSILKDRKDIK